MPAERRYLFNVDRILFGERSVKRCEMLDISATTSYSLKKMGTLGRRSNFVLPAALMLLAVLVFAASAFGARKATATDPNGDTLSGADLTGAEVQYSVESGTASALLQFANPVDDTTNLVITVQYATYRGGLGGRCGSGQTSGVLSSPAGGASQVTLSVNEYTSFNGGGSWNPERTQLMVSASDRRLLERKIDLECVSEISLYDWRITTLVDQITAFDLPIYTAPPPVCNYVCQYKKQVSACKKKYKRKSGVRRAVARKRAKALKRCLAVAVYKKQVRACKAKYEKNTGDSSTVAQTKARALKKCVASAKKSLKKKLKTRR